MQFVASCGVYRNDRRNYRVLIQVRKYTKNDRDGIMSFTAKVYEYPTGHSAEERRTHIFAEATPSDGLVRHIIIHQLFPEGLRVEAYPALLEGAEVDFDIPDLGPRKATVVKQNGAFSECAFHGRFHPTQIRTKRLSAKVVWGNFRQREIDRDFVRQADQSNGSLLHPQFSDEIDEDHWPKIIRLTILVAGAVFCWATPILFVRIVLG